MRCHLPLSLLLLVVAPLPAAEPAWHLPEWSARAIVAITQPAAEADVDVAGVKVLCQGAVRADAADYRVLNAAGQPVPFQVVFHDAQRYSLISFKVSDVKAKAFVYFGNPRAERSPEQIVADPAPGTGPPRGAWVPRFGFVLQTIRRPPWREADNPSDPPINDNPRSVAELARLLADSPGKDGARYQRRVSDGYNPFGSSDQYMSIYRGWIRIPKAGKYAFCTASNEASFSFIDGQKLVHWPGRHTAERGARGEVNETVDLTAGLHYLEYYHEEVTLDQMAFLGWKREGEATFGPIPESVYTAPHTATVERYESPKGQRVTFEPSLLDSVLPPPPRTEGQYTRYRFTVNKQPELPAGTACIWEFGDGQTATGAEVDHVYLALGRYMVKLTAKSPQGEWSATWPLNVFEIDHEVNEFKKGSLPDYARQTAGYDLSKLDVASLRELVYLQAEAGGPAAGVKAANDFVTRFGAKARPEELARVRKAGGDCAVRLGKDGWEQAIALLEASIVPAAPVTDRLDALATLARLYGIEQDKPDQVADVLARMDEVIKGHRFTEESRTAYRRALIAAGDTLLWRGQVSGAVELYKKAEQRRKFIPQAVRSAQVGALAESMRTYLAKDLKAAAELLDKLEDQFPTEKVKGATFFWRGQLLQRQNEHRQAARYLARSIGLSPGADTETEARWLLAVSLEQIGKPDEARRELARLIATGAKDEFTQRAREKLKTPPPK